MIGILVLYVFIYLQFCAITGVLLLMKEAMKLFKEIISGYQR